MEVFIICAVIGIFLIMLTLYGICYFALQKYGKRATGIVVKNIYERGNYDDDESYRAVVRFEDERGKVYQEQLSLITSWEEFKRGEEVSICYSINNPENFIIEYNFSLNFGTLYIADNNHCFSSVPHFYTLNF